LPAHNCRLQMPTQRRSASRIVAAIERQQDRQGRLARAVLEESIPSGQLTDRTAAKSIPGVSRRINAVQHIIADMEILPPHGMPPSSIVLRIARASFASAPRNNDVVRFARKAARKRGAEALLGTNSHNDSGTLKRGHCRCPVRLSSSSATT
jgi:hypothetical protein